jgi:hypothetical protein
MAQAGNAVTTGINVATAEAGDGGFFWAGDAFTTGNNNSEARGGNGVTGLGGDAVTSGIGSLARGGFGLRALGGNVNPDLYGKAQEKGLFHAFNMPLHSRRDGPRAELKKKNEYDLGDKGWEIEKS